MFYADAELTGRENWLRQFSSEERAAWRCRRPSHLGCVGDFRCRATMVFKPGLDSRFAAQKSARVMLPAAIQRLQVLSGGIAPVRERASSRLRRNGRLTICACADETDHSCCLNQGQSSSGIPGRAVEFRLFRVYFQHNLQRDLSRRRLLQTLERLAQGCGKVFK